MDGFDDTLTAIALQSVPELSGLECSGSDLLDAILVASTHMHGYGHESESRKQISRVETFLRCIDIYQRRQSRWRPVFVPVVEAAACSSPGLANGRVTWHLA